MTSKLAKMRLQQRYSNSNANNSNSANGTKAAHAIGSSNNNSNSSSSNNNRLNNPRAKIQNLINNSNNNNNSNRNGFLKLRSAAKAAPATIATTATTATTTTINNSSNNNCSLVETLEETTTAVELRSTAAGGAGENDTHYRAYNTLRSNSTSAILAEAAVLPGLLGNGSSILYARPRTLNVHNVCQTPAQITQLFFGEVLNAWRAKARCNVVPDERTEELFHELSFHPSQKQISEMLQTAKKVARKSRGQTNGLTFGQFCVLAADLKRFRASIISNSINYSDVRYPQVSSSLMHHQQQEQQDNASEANSSDKMQNLFQAGNGLHYSKKSENYGTELRSTKSFSSVDDTKKKKNVSNEPVEVFLGGSCNPTTWRADVAIPALKELGISFYNPQVSDWTPDLIELEHRAKEKARVLFFVMDSETRASAGAIEAAHIAGQNCKQLVLVLHPYKPNQNILNEPISHQEYLDLIRNQLILKELVSRRGLPVLDNIPSGLQRTKDILAGIWDPPSKISSILNTVRGAFDRVNPQGELLTVEQCKRALLFLGYAQSLVNLNNLTKIIINQRESLKLLHTQSTKASSKQLAEEEELLDSTQQQQQQQQQPSQQNCNSSTMPNHELIDFDLFCVISAYLSVLQQEIHESGCISPIKGTNVPPPQVYFTNAPDVDIYFSASKNISRTSSNASVPSNSSSGIGHDSMERPNLFDQLSRSRDSGTSSPQPLPQPSTTSSAAMGIETKPHNLLGAVSTTTMPPASAATPAQEEEESDSNDSVFSSSSSIASAGDALYCSSLELRDVYLGGSCVLRTKWRQQLAAPYLQANGVSFHNPALHESINQQMPPQEQKDSSRPQEQQQQQQQQQCSFVRTRRKCRGSQFQLEEQEELTVAEESLSWSLPQMVMRQTLYNPALLESSRVLLFVITNETRSLAPMTLAAHCIGLMYNVVLAVQMLPDDCVLGGEKLTVAAIKDYNRGRSYLIDLAKRQGVPVFNDIQGALECTVAKVQAYNNRERS
ncbi:homeobox protein 5 isoform X2 [Drosophila grimshawi]|uniref:homeobox protein 5 isoform X2 n=1 Tax=Drosophila grimshawi TaxID=7222 RepID=UPI001C933B1C|nr:homeobox protein 5 isoform X2 [Drosophila grimshawi]